MKTKLMAVLLVAGGSMFAQTRFSVGVQFGAPGYYQPAPVAPAPAAVAYRPPCPGPGYVWVDGYRDAYGQWANGYWARPPYSGAYWVAPQYSGGRFVAGYWGGERGERFRDSREREWREHEWREHRDRDRRDDFRHDFRR